MASDQFKVVLFTLVLFCLFSSMMILAVKDLGTTYGVSSSEIGEGALNDENFQESIDNVANKSENYRQRFEDGKIVDVDNASGIFTIASDFISMITSPFKLMGSVLVMLGVPFVVISVVLGLLSITLILSMWRLLKTGD